MGEALPGSSSGRSIGEAVSKAALRLLGGSDLADAITDMTGIGRKTIKTLVRDATERMDRERAGEFSHLGLFDRKAAETMVVRAYQGAARKGQTEPY